MVNITVQKNVLNKGLNMILIGDKLVPYEDFSFITSSSKIEDTKSNSTVLFNYNEEILKYCYKNNISNAIIVNSIKEAIYANALESKYIIASIVLAKEIQKIADNYMFDSKILAIIETNDELEQIASFEIDGVIYQDLLK